MIEKNAKLTAADCFVGFATQYYVCVARIPTKIEAVSQVIDFGRESQSNIASRSIDIW